MGKASVNIAINGSTTAGLTTWNMAFLQLMLDAGFVQTTDTGQMTSETSANGTSGTSFGYAIFRFNDALQSTHPIFIKVEFGTFVSSAAYSHYITVGKGTNGSGSLTGIIFPRTAFSVNNVSTVYSDTPFTHIAVAGGSYCAFIGAVNDTRTDTGSPYVRRFFIVERSRAADGTATGDGLLVVIANSGGGTAPATINGGNYNNGFRAINYETGAYIESGAVAVSGYSINGTALGPTTSLAAGSIGPVIPWDVIAPGLVPWRSCIAVTIPGGDMPSGVFQTNLCGHAGIFYPVPPSQSHHRWGVALEYNASGGSYSRWFGLGIRWED